MKGFILFSSFIIKVAFCENQSSVTTFNDRATLNGSLINELKSRVLHKIPPASIISQFQNDDLYWTNWLEVNSFNLNTTCASFLHHLKWRQHTKMDTIHLEDWSYFRAEYPAYIDSVDKRGRPVTEIWFSDWNTRRAVIIGRQRQLVRWMMYISEMGMRALFEGRAQGKNITGGMQLIDYTGFNMITQGCPSCLQLYNIMTSEGIKHYPGIMDEIYILNMAPRFQFLFQFWRDNLQNQKSRQGLMLYNNELQWKPLINAKIDKNQLGIRFGGTKDRLNV